MSKKNRGETTENKHFIEIYGIHAVLAALKNTNRIGGGGMMNCDFGMSLLGL